MSNMRMTNPAQVAYVVSNAAFSEKMVEIPRGSWPLIDKTGKATAEAVFRSRSFLVVLWREDDHLRLSINRTLLSKTRLGHFEDGITFDEIQKIKSEVGFGDFTGLEVYPRDSDLIDVANMRHIWLFKEPPSFAWGQK